MVKTKICLISCLVFLLAGCASLKEDARCLAGTSTKVLEDGRKDAVKIILGCAYSECYDKALDKLKKIDTYIYFEDKNKQMIAFYLHKAGQAKEVVTQTNFTITDTTPVGIFFSEIDPKNTRVEVSSPSTYAREFIAAEISVILEKTDEKK
ncbi:MAG: hypothetical protein PHG40_05180 [Candidatus Omnitrophica bacterium]|nr:hypothetical protein [Candidatus Omnitrophota bacterium]